MKKPNGLSEAIKIFEEGGWYSSLEIQQKLKERTGIYISNPTNLIADLRKKPHLCVFDKRRTVTENKKHHLMYRLQPKTEVPSIKELKKPVGQVDIFQTDQHGMGAKIK